MLIALFSLRFRRSQTWTLREENVSYTFRSRPGAARSRFLLNFAFSHSNRKLKVGDGSDPLALALSTAAAGPPDLSLNSDLTSQFSESASVGSNSLRGVDGEAWEGRRQANLVRDGVGFETIEGIKGDGEQGETLSEPLWAIPRELKIFFLVHL